MRQLYKKLIEKFKSEETKDSYRTKGLKPPQFVDLYAGQDIIPEKFEVMNYPALLVDWTIDHKAVPPLATVNFHLCYEQLRDTSSLGKNTDEALKYLDFIDQTDEILKLIETPHTGKLNLISEGNKLDDTVVDVYNLSYQCSYSGKLTVPQSGYVRGDFNDLETKSGIYSKLLE